MRLLGDFHLGDLVPDYAVDLSTSAATSRTSRHPGEKADGRSMRWRTNLTLELAVPVPGARRGARRRSRRRLHRHLLHAHEHPSGRGEGDLRHREDLKDMPAQDEVQIIEEGARGSVFPAPVRIVTMSTHRATGSSSAHEARRARREGRCSPAAMLGTEFIVERDMVLERSARTQARLDPTREPDEIAPRSRSRRGTSRARRHFRTNAPRCSL